MIDVTRWYLEVSTIKKLIDSLMFNKMNVLHIHFSDNPTFPLYIEEIPELSKNSAYSES